MLMKKEKIAPIREGLVMLTGNFKNALVLNQFIYWSGVNTEFTKLIDEENRVRTNHGLDPIELETGWIYKTAKELNEELMLGATEVTIRKYLKELLDNEFLFQRKNPKYRWDNTLQYRVNFKKVMDGLNELGFHLADYKIKDK